MQEKDIAKLLGKTRKKSEDIYDIVATITDADIHRNDEIAFLIQLAMSRFGESNESDIVLCSWGYLDGYSDEPSVGKRRVKYVLETGYRGDGSKLAPFDESDIGLRTDRLLKHENRLYEKLASYYLSSVKDADSFVAAARSSWLTDNGTRVLYPKPNYLTDTASVGTLACANENLINSNNENENTIIPDVEKISADKDPKRKKRTGRRGAPKGNAIKPWQLALLALLSMCLTALVLFLNPPSEEQLALTRLGKALGDVGTEAVLENADASKKLLLQLQNDIEKLKIENAQIEELLARSEAGDMEAAYQLGLIYYTKEDYESTYNWLKTAAESDHSQAQVALGALYMYGLGVEKDVEQAFNWAMKAAEQGNPSGENNIGYMYQTGAYVDLDYDKAFAWYQKAAEQRLDVAFDNLGVSYFNGWGTEVDYVKALECFVDAYNAGFDISADHIAFMYQKGYGVKVDIETAIKWYSIGADNDDSLALAELGKIYEKGEGVQKDLATAFDYYYRSAELGYTWAMRTVAYWYYTGQYVDKDYDEALKWLTRASEAGDEKATENLRQFEETLALLGK